MSDQTGVPEGYTRIAGYERFDGGGVASPPVPGVGPVLSVLATEEGIVVTRRPAEGEMPETWVLRRGDAEWLPYWDTPGVGARRERKE